MSTTFNNIGLAFNTIAYPFSNILLELFRGTKSTRVLKTVPPTLVRVIKPTMPLVRVIKPAMPVMARVAEPVAPTYTRTQ